MKKSLVLTKIRNYGFAFILFRFMSNFDIVTTYEMFYYGVMLIISFAFWYLFIIQIGVFYKDKKIRKINNIFFFGLLINTIILLIGSIDILPAIVEMILIVFVALSFIVYIVLYFMSTFRLAKLSANKEFMIYAYINVVYLVSVLITANISIFSNQNYLIIMRIVEILLLALFIYGLSKFYKTERSSIEVSCK